MRQPPAHASPPAHPRLRPASPPPAPRRPPSWSQHVKHCKSCRGAVAWIERLQAACTAVAALAAPIGAWTLLQKALLASAAAAADGAAAAGLGGAAAAAGAMSLWLGWPMVALAVAALLARAKLREFNRRFHYTDYVHAAVA
jgi:hypothetical protein